MVGQAREGTPDKTGVGRTKDDGAVTVQRKAPGTPCRRTRHPRQPTRNAPCAGGANVVDGRDNAWGSRAPGPHAHGNAARQVVDGLRTEVCGQQKQSNDPPQQPAQPQYANYWAPLTRKPHTPPHPAQPQHTNHWAPRTRKRHQQEHRPQRPTESSDPTQHAKGRTGDGPGPRKETTTRRNVTQGGGGGMGVLERPCTVGGGGLPPWIPNPPHPPPLSSRRSRRQCHIPRTHVTVPDTNKRQSNKGATNSGAWKKNNFYVFRSSAVGPGPGPWVPLCGASVGGDWVECRAGAAAEMMPLRAV